MKASLPTSQFLIAAVCGAALVAFAVPDMLVLAEAPKASVSQAVPVETDMHEFMEYVFQPTYLRLKQSMAAAPADNKAWKAVKADALILAEGGNLLLSRSPEKNAAAWNELSAAVREAGGQLYQAAKKKDFQAARPHYEAMLKKCNACHDQFADGEHQLAP